MRPKGGRAYFHVALEFLSSPLSKGLGISQLVLGDLKVRLLFSLGGEETE